jgi:hypothetical protein
VHLSQLLGQAVQLFEDKKNLRLHSEQTPVDEQVLQLRGQSLLHDPLLSVYPVAHELHADEVHLVQDAAHNTQDPVVAK